MRMVYRAEDIYGWKQRTEWCVALKETFLGKQKVYLSVTLNRLTFWSRVIMHFLFSCFFIHLKRLVETLELRTFWLFFSNVTLRIPNRNISKAHFRFSCLTGRVVQFFFWLVFDKSFRNEQIDLKTFFSVFFGKKSGDHLLLFFEFVQILTDTHRFFISELFLFLDLFLLIWSPFCI